MVTLERSLVRSEQEEWEMLSLGQEQADVSGFIWDQSEAL